MIRRSFTAVTSDNGRVATLDARGTSSGSGTVDSEVEAALHYVGASAWPDLLAALVERIVWSDDGSDEWLKLPIAQGIRKARAAIAARPDDEVDP